MPVNTWGENYVFLPTAQAQDQCRVLSETNGTVVTFQTNAGNNVQVLNAGQYYDTTVDYANPVFINGSNPISVGRFLRTGSCNNYYITNPTGKGDPSEVIVDANEQMYLDTIAFYVSRTPDIDSTYIQIVTRTTDKNTVFLDNVNIGAFFTTLIPNPTYSYCSLTILPGAHTLTTTGQGFVAYTCGLGFEDAMAAAAGVYLNEININVSSTQPSTCSGSDGTATANVTGISPFLYTWSNGQTTQTATGLSAGIYTVTVTDSDCVPHKATATVSISGKAGYSATISDTNPNCKNAFGNATANPAGGTAPYTYSWSDGATTQTATGLSAGSYTCTVTDNTGCRYFVTTTIINYNPPGIGIAPYNDSVCGVDSTHFLVYGLNTGIYNWTPSSSLTCNVCPSPIATPTTTTTYTITGVDSSGCTASATVTIAVLRTPKPIITGKDSICSGYSDTLSVTGGVNYQWSTGATTSTITGVITSSRTITVTAYNGYCPPHDTSFAIYVVPTPTPVIAASTDTVCKGDSIKLNGSGGVTYRWSSGKTTTTIWVKPDTTATYYLYAFSGDCEDSTKITLYVKPITTLSVTALNDTVCPKGISTLTATGSGGNVRYKWSNGATTSSINVSDTITKTYTVTVYGACDSVKKNITVTVVPLDKPVVTGTSSKCGGITDTLTVSGGGAYKWGNGSTSTQYITGAINADSTIYVVAYNARGCPDTAILKITEKARPAIKPIPPTISCGGSDVILNAKVTGTGPFTYLWSNGETTSSITVHDTSETGYTVTVSNGCINAVSTTVTPDSAVIFACCNKTILAGDDTSIIASGDTGIISYSWSPSVSCKNPPKCDSVSVSPTVTTTYTVTGTDYLGCQTSRVITITVETPCFNFTVPNVFTPNFAGPNGENNEFYIETKNISNWSIVIYDRWGKEMFKTNNPNVYWNGNTESGSKAPDGVYYYILSGTCENNTYKKDGFLQLIR